MQCGFRKSMLAMVAIPLVSALTGCAGVRLYPIEGPLSAQTPPPIFSAKISGIISGPFSFTLTGGEVCKGHWAPHESQNISANQLAGLHRAWDKICGPGFYTAHVLGISRLASGTGTTNKGSNLSLELIVPNGGGEGEQNLDHIHGIAVDNQGNVFKVTLRGFGDRS